MFKKIFSSRFFVSIKSFCIAHKKTSIIIGLVILFIIWKIYSALTSTAGVVKYITANVARGTLIASVSGSGQVSASNQIDLKPKVAGDVTYIGVSSGELVKAGTLMVALNARDASKAVRDAEINLASAKLSLEKLKLQNSDENMNADLAKAYDDGFSAVSDAFLDLPSIITGLDSLLSEDNISYNKARASGKVASEYRDQVDTLYYEAQKKFETNRDHYRMLDRNSSKADIERVINETYDTAKLLADTIKAAKNLVDYLADYTNSASEFTTASSTLSTYTNTINSHFSNLLFIKTSIKNYKDAFPSTSLDIQSSELSVKQRENALQDAREKLSDYYIRAPFDGVVAKVDVKKLDTVTSSTIVATFITDQKIAEIPLNEVDIAKVKIGQKVDLTFDAIPDLSISGTVAEMDTVGTVDQGVVTYNVKIGFDINDERVKPNMSVSADVVTDTATDVLYVPNSAIKSGKDGYYVEVFGQPLISTGAAFAGIPSKVSPTRKGVEIGLTNNNFTQIVSGLTEGEQVVARIISGTKTATTNSAPSLFGPQTNGRNGGTVRTTPSAR